MKIIISISSIHFYPREVFKKVIDNIIDSVRRAPRNIYLMLYYPTFEYQRVMRDSRYFVLKNIIKLSGYEEDPDEKCVCVSHVKILCVICHFGATADIGR